jgi:ketosteroid isomerase-like protein
MPVRAILRCGMSENLDLVRSIYADWERGDYFRRADWADPHIEFVWADGPDPGSWTGPDEMAKAWSDQLRLFQDYRAVAEEFRELDRERVLVLGHNRGRGKISSAESGALGGRSAVLFEIRDGKVARLALYWDRDRALADLGLEG